MNPVLDNAVATINAYVDAFKARHKDVEVPLPKLAGEHVGLPAYVIKAYYRLDRDDRPSRNRAKYGAHGLVVTLESVDVPKGNVHRYRMNFNAVDVPGLVL